MGFFKNLANKAAIKATRSELEGLEIAIGSFSRMSAGGIFQATANLRSTLCEHLPHPYNLYFTVSVNSTRRDFQGKEQIRKGAALLLPVLTACERDSDDEITKWALHFWRVVLMTMLHDELYEEGRSLWALVFRIEEKITETKFDAQIDAILDEDECDLLYHLRPLYYLRSS